MSYKIYGLLALIPLMLLCNVSLGITEADVKWFATVLVGGAIMMAIIMIFVVAGNGPKK